MKLCSAHAYILLLSLSFSLSGHAACKSLDYQELKDMNEQDFRTYACKVKKDLKTAELTYSAMKTITELRADFRRIDGNAPDPNDNASEEANNVEACKSELERLERIARTRQPKQELASTMEACGK